MKQMYVMLVIAAIVALAGLVPASVVAQDSRIPGGAQFDSIKAEVRNGKLVFASADGNFRWWFDSRLQVDAAMYFENKNLMSNGAHFRRLTFALKAMLHKYWEAEFDVDFAEQVDTKPQTELRDMWIKFTPPDMSLSLQVGHFKEPFGLERLNSSRLLTFLERSSISSALPLGRRIGIQARYWWPEFAQMTGAIMGHEPATRIDKGQRDEGWSSNLRASVSPINQYGHVLHVGAAGSYKIPDATSELKPNTIEISARTESYVFNPKFLHTGDIADVNHYLRYGGELLYVNGPIYLQGEVMGTTINRWYGKPAVNLKGGYAMATYMLTGETRYYYSDEGEIGPVEAPKNSWGALEVAGRYTITDLNDGAAGVRGGMAKQLMLGLNYYPNTSIKLQFNYSLVDLDQYATRKGNLFGDDDHSFIQVRFQASM
ncbi:MAG: OprO/OprP family phosphate-selective porin [Bacteroidetes bacterium]|jgi:phosphate-selective porin OprO/OprP|nr:OprO/OprP family phosphate-selective porin [Bacteroidota bacterium]